VGAFVNHAVSPETSKAVVVAPKPTTQGADRCRRVGARVAAGPVLPGRDEGPRVAEEVVAGGPGGPGVARELVDY